jgi:hypothetical protein
MPHTAAELLEEARKLPLAERHWLIDTLKSENDQVAEEAFKAWQKEAGEPEPGYEEWFRFGVEEVLADDSPGTPHEEAMRDIGKILCSAREAKKLKESA